MFLNSVVQMQDHQKYMTQLLIISLPVVSILSLFEAKTENCFVYVDGDFIYTTLIITLERLSYVEGK